MPKQEVLDITSFDPSNPHLIDNGSGKKERKTNITRRGWAVIGGAVLAPVLAVSALHGGGDAKEQGPATGTYTVQPGDTLGHIATEVARDTPGKQTLEEVEDQIIALNPGQNMYKDEGLTADLQTLNLPTAVDQDKETPGIQLEK